MKTLIDYKKELNPPQLEAVKYTESPLLVLAGAGSGKTRVITYKIAYLINECGITPEGILAVTFTNKAANEMKERVEKLIGREVDIWVRTFHSSAVRILRGMAGFFDIDPSFTIVDADDQLSIVKLIIKEMGLDQDIYRPQKYAYLIERAKDRLLFPREAFDSGFSTDPLFYEIYEKYQNKLENENLLDFGDLIFRLVRGLKKNQSALKVLKERFKYVLIDEFQDTNHAQYELVKLLCLPRGNICVVGDDDQSIYGFRGARIENIYNFLKDFPNAKVVKLEQNYRSYRKILSASSSVIDKNPSRMGKKLFTRKGEGENLVFFRAGDDFKEAIYVASQIKKLRNDGYRYSDIAVFYRMNAQSRAFEVIFNRLQIPYRLVGSVRFYDREEIKDIFGYLKILINPYDEVSIRRIASKPPRGIGEKTLDWILKSTVYRGMPVFALKTMVSEEENSKKNAEDAYSNNLSSGEDESFRYSGDFVGTGEKVTIPVSKRKQVCGFINLLLELRTAMSELPPTEFIKELYLKSGYLDWLRKNNKIEKIRNLEELYNAIEEYFKTYPEARIEDYVNDASLYQSIDEAGEGADAVLLITLHNAKGLEFPVVFMVGMEAGIFPHYLSSDTRAELEEERRLCYVGMTRAMEKLFMTAAKKRKLFGRTVERDVSCFIRDIPPELLEEDSHFDPYEMGIVYGDYSFGDYQNTLGTKKESLNSDVTYYTRKNRIKMTYSDKPGKSGVETISKKTLKPEEVEVGDRVIHGVYGSGRVWKKDGDVVLIEFDDGKKMSFILKYAPLEKEN